MQRRDEAHACRGLAKAFSDGAGGTLARFMPSVLARREDGEHAVADEFQHIAALGSHRVNDDLEIGAEPLQQGIGRKPLRQAGRNP